MASYRDSAVLTPGNFAGLRFFEGTIYIVVLASEETITRQHFNSDAKQAVASDIGFFTPQDSQNRNLLEPATTDVIHQVFTGIAPSTVRLYVNFPSGRTTRALRGVRSIGGDTGYIRGIDSAYNEPDAMTEIWCTKDVYPDYDPYLPPWVRRTQYVNLEHRIIKYKYGVVTDPALIAAFTRREKKFRPITMGMPDAPANRPSFLDQYADLMRGTIQLEGSVWGTVPARPA